MLDICTGRSCLSERSIMFRGMVVQLLQLHTAITGSIMLRQLMELPKRADMEMLSLETRGTVEAVSRCCCTCHKLQPVPRRSCGTRNADACTCVPSSTSCSASCRCFFSVLKRRSRLMRRLNVAKPGMAIQRESSAG